MTGMHVARTNPAPAVTFGVEVLSSEAGRSSAYLLRQGESIVLVDCGPGAAVALARRGLLAHLDAVTVTHQHADHAADVIGLAYARRFPDRLARIPLYAPAATIDALAALDDLFAVPTLPDMGNTIASSFELMVLPTNGERVAISHELTLSSFAVRHAVASAALRFHSPTTTVAFSSDTGPCEALGVAAERADLFLCEATYLHASPAELEVHGHLTPELAARIAADAEVDRLALTHLSRPTDAPAAARAAGHHFDADRLEIAHAGTTLSV